MGFHSYLQLHRVPFESQRAKEINEEIFKRIKEQALEETLILGAEKAKRQTWQEQDVEMLTYLL